MKTPKEMERFIEGGAVLLKATMEGASKEKMWDLLIKKGYSPEECVEIAQNVSGFMNHKRGNHEKCPPNCGLTEELSKNSDFVDNMSMNEKIDYVDDKLTQGKHHYSNDNLEEWK